MISEQIVWLVKHSNLNFQLNETPFSLNLNLKKRFIQHWLPESHPQASFETPVPSQSQANYHPSCQNHPHENPSETSRKTSSESSASQNLINQISQLKQTLEIVNNEKEELEKENISLNRLNKKLAKDAADLQRKHEKVCEEIKIFKSDKDSILKDLNVKSVALTSAKKDLKDLKNISDEKLKKFEVKIVKLQEFKEGKEAEDRKARKALKKARQKERKKSEIKDSSLNEPDDPDQFEDLHSNTEFNDNEVTFKKETFERDNITPSTFPINSDHNPNDTLDNNAKNVKPPDIHPSDDAFKEVAVENPEDVEKQASETRETTLVDNISDSPGSAPLTKKDLEDMWNSFAEEFGYQTINLTNKNQIYQLDGYHTIYSLATIQITLWLPYHLYGYHTIYYWLPYHIFFIITFWARIY